MPHVLCAEACADHFNLVTAISFSRAKTEPGVTNAPAPPPVRRQPREEPEVLGEHSEAGGRNDSMPDWEARRQPRASNASVSSITVSRRPAGSSISSISQALNAGL